eukprot:3675190-Rhodomonas_salina.1
MSEASTILRQRTGTLSGVPAETVVQFRLLLLPPAVLGHLWPADRMVVGLRVCIQLRRDLLTQCTNMVLVQEADAVQSDSSSVLEDFRRLPQNLMLTLRWTEKKSAQRLARVLGDCKALAHLDMSGNQIGAEGAGPLSRVLGGCTTLAHLSLIGNAIGVEGASRLAGVLGGCKALANLDLSQNMIGAEGAGHLAGALGRCKELANVDLSWNKIGAEGAGAFARALGKCKTLAHLSLQHNKIGDEGAGRLAG